MFSCVCNYSFILFVPNWIIHVSLNLRQKKKKKIQEIIEMPRDWRMLILKRKKKKRPFDPKGNLVN